MVVPQPDHRGNWAARVVIIGALVVILVASAILYQQLNQQTEVLSDQNLIAVTPPPPPRPTGSVSLESVPQGAVIYLDDKAMQVSAAGDLAKTPSDLTSLQYGTKYKIRLQKDGYKAFETEFEMGESTDKSTIRPTLEPFPGTLIAEVVGQRRQEVRVFFDNQDVGLGPRVEKELPGNATVLVRGVLSGMECEAAPARVRLAPSQT